MVIVSALKKYFALDSKQKEFIRTGQRIFLARPEELLTFLKPLAGFDKECDSARSRCGLFMFLVILGWFVMMIFTGGEPSILSLRPATIHFFIIAIFFTHLFLYFFFRKIDIHNNLREFVVPIINSISQDMNKDEKIRLKLDFRGKCIPAKQLKQEKHDPGWFSYPKETITFYRDNWLDGSAILHDGSKLFFSVTDLPRKLERSKKNPRGKIKSKTKYKIKHRIKVGLALKNKNYSFNENERLTAAGDRLKHKQGEKRNVISLTRVLISNSVDSVVEPISMLALIGKILMSARPATDKG